MLNKPLAAACAASAVIIAQLSGASFRPDRDPQTDQWYRNLDKSALTPPGAVFGIAWTILDSLLGYSGYRLMTSRPSRSRSAAFCFWALSLTGVVAHPWTMFKRRRLDEATAVTAGMIGSAGGLIATAANVDRRAMWFATPLGGWVIFAMYLQVEFGDEIAGNDDGAASGPGLSFIIKIMTSLSIARGILYRVGSDELVDDSLANLPVPRHAAEHAGIKCGKAVLAAQSSGRSFTGP